MREKEFWCKYMLQFNRQSKKNRWQHTMRSSSLNNTLTDWWLFNLWWYQRTFSCSDVVRRSICIKITFDVSDFLCYQFGSCPDNKLLFICKILFMLTQYTKTSWTVPLKPWTETKITTMPWQFLQSQAINNWRLLV